ncbi:MAG: hypothetical protein R2854_01520 [Caldilineaceae bacterium]
MGLTHGHQFVFNTPVQQIVGRLFANEAGRFFNSPTMIAMTFRHAGAVELPM